jgi:hypothetical protein
MEGAVEHDWKAAKHDAWRVAVGVAAIPSQGRVTEVSFLQKETLPMPMSTAATATATAMAQCNALMLYVAAAA